MSAYMAYLTGEVGVICSLLLSNDQDQYIEGLSAFSLKKEIFTSDS